MREWGPMTVAAAAAAQESVDGGAVGWRWHRRRVVRLGPLVAATPAIAAASEATSQAAAHAVAGCASSYERAVAGDVRHAGEAGPEAASGSISSSMT